MNCVAKSACRMMRVSDLDECYSFAMAWSLDALREMMQDRLSIGFVREVGDRVTAFVIFRNGRWQIELLDFGWHPEFPREMQELLDNVKQRMYREINCVVACVPETDLDRQIMLRSVGFVCNGIIDGDDPLYRFVHSKEQSDGTQLHAETR